MSMKVRVNDYEFVSGPFSYTPNVGYSARVRVNSNPDRGTGAYYPPRLVEIEAKGATMAEAMEDAVRQYFEFLRENPAPKNVQTS